MKNFFLSFLVVAALFTGAAAQSNTGDLVITVSDPGGVIPGASVVITDEQTNNTRTVVTGDEGTVSVPQLNVGTYTVRITAPGRKTQVYNAVKIDVGRTYSLNATLEAGDVSATVEITAGADTINSTSGEISTTVSERQIQELPLNGRNPLALITLQAGTSSNGAQSTVINGQRSSFTNITRDGLNVQDNFIRANATDFVPDRPSVDDTGEFTVTTQNAGAEAGYGASQVQLVTPRGSNEFHGALFIYNRNSEFTANTFFRNASKVDRPFLNRNQFGGRVSGPILKDRFFFFGSYEGFRLRQSTLATRTILTAPARTGIFTYTDNAGVVRQINLFAPPFQRPGVTGINPIIQSRILANLPTAGNTTTVGDQLNTTGLFINRAQNQDRESYTMRLDFEPNDKNSFSGVFAFREEELLRPDVDAQQGGVAAGFGAIPSGFQSSETPSFNLSWRWIPTGTFTNELRGGMIRSRPVFGSTNQPAFFIQAPLINNPESGFQGQGRYTSYGNIQDNAVLSRGSHAIRFGGQVQFFRIQPFGPGAFGNPTLPNFVLGGGATPTFDIATFNAAAGCVAATGVNCISQGQLGTANSLLALLGGLVGSANTTFNANSPTSGFIQGQVPLRNLHYEHISFYASDQWRARPNLTVNFGLRYELFKPLREPNNFALEPVLPNGTLGDVTSALLNPNGTYNFVGTNAGGSNFFKTDRDNFAPIVSVAYSPNFKNKFLGSLLPGEGRSVIRAGFRISYVNDEFVRAADNALAGNAGLSQPVQLTGLNTTLNNLPTFATPTFQVPRTFAQNNVLAGNFGTVFAIDPNIQVPRTMEYSIGFQREIGFQTAVEIRYVGSRSNNLVQGLDLNQVRLNDNGFLADFNRARNNLLLYNNPNCTVTATTPNCQPLQLLNTSAFGPNAAALLNNATIRTLIQTGAPGDLAFNYIATQRVGSATLLPNANAGVVDLVGNFAKYRYNSLQIELRRRFSQGLYAQANYTLQKTLTDAAGTAQSRFEPLIDNARREIEFNRADYDQEHVFNFNAIYELPFGQGKAFLNRGGWLNRLVGGFQVTSIIRLASGAPITIIDPRGTFNRAGRSGRQTANTNLTNQEVANLIGIFKTPCGVFFINPTAININQTNLQAGNCSALGSGRGAEGFGTTPFAGQAFFNVSPGETGTQARNSFNGPTFFNWDASLIKNIAINERMRVQLRAEAFNITNRANFFVGQFGANTNINSTTFGRVTSTFDPRILQFVGRFEF